MSARLIPLILLAPLTIPLGYNFPHPALVVIPPITLLLVYIIMTKKSPFERLIESAEVRRPPSYVSIDTHETHNRVPASNPILDTDFDEEGPESNKFTVLAIFKYHDESTKTIPFPRKPIGLSKRINNMFCRPVSVRFRTMNSEFRPKSAANLESWKEQCHSVTRPQEA
jgi:hypothetical protein